MPFRSELHLPDLGQHLLPQTAVQLVHTDASRTMIILLVSQEAYLADISH